MFSAIKARREKLQTTASKDGCLAAEDLQQYLDCAGRVALSRGNGVQAAMNGHGGEIQQVAKELVRRHSLNSERTENLCRKVPNIEGHDHQDHIPTAQPSPQVAPPTPREKPVPSPHKTGMPAQVWCADHLEDCEQCPRGSAATSARETSSRLPQLSRRTGKTAGSSQRLTPPPPASPDPAHSTDREHGGDSAGAHHAAAEHREYVGACGCPPSPQARPSPRSTDRDRAARC